MKGFSRFSSVAAAPVVLLLLAKVVVGCIPNPDTSGLPPYDAGLSSTEDVSIPSTDSSVDGTIIFDSGADTAPVDSAPPLGTVSGVVIDFTQGNGRGVVAGALVSISVPGNATASVPAAVTADANGTFTIANVPAGMPIQIGATKPTDLTNGIAYSSTFLVTTVAAGQTVNVFPVLHEGCFQTLNIAAGADGGVSLQNASCPYGAKRFGAYAAMTFDATSFKDPIGGSLYSGNVRIEMIPLAYPVNGTAPDLSWAVGLPGVTTPPGLLGAAEYRVVKSDPGQPDDGNLLALQDPVNHPVTIAVPVYTAPTVTTLSYSYGTAGGSWNAETTAPPSALQDAGPPNQYVTIQVPHLSWWAATNGVASTTCVTGTLQQAGAPAANVLVHGAGVNYLGSSTGITSSAGLFCLDVTSLLSDGGASEFGLVAGAFSGGIVSTATQLIPIGSLTAGSCANPTSCQSIGTPITLAPSLTCVSGNVTTDAGATPPSPMNATAVSFQGVNLNYAFSAGIQSTAYIGQVTLGAGGAFCALAPPGSGIQLTAPGNTNGNCFAPNYGTGTGSAIQVLNGTSAPSCGAGGCGDAGVAPYNCDLGG